MSGIKTQSKVLASLNQASAAEDFFTLLGVAYDAKLVNVARLHILKRMGQYLASEDFDGLPDEVVAARCKAVLERAYEDFVRSSPLDQRVFKVLKEAVAPPKPANFVPLDVLK
ncbi:MAG TPA: nitrogenase stabilizing/protective protein NifW [Pseudolabrys sp.]|nr:nitrogenase stabilizing/protective protein NifW [Pseudolabrys sp.]